jgi:hypothetical protein
MNATRPHSLIKPTPDTPFHIDIKWWQRSDQNWRVYLFNLLCEEHQQAFSESDMDVMIDWIDSKTAEVSQVNGLQHTLMTHCARQDDFLSTHTALVDSVFHVFIANGNSPLTPRELSEMVGKPAVTILRTLSGPKVYKGLRPVQS